MTPRRILLVDQAGAIRDAVARVLTGGGHEVRVVDPQAVEGPANDFAPDAVVYGEGCLQTSRSEARVILLRRPVNMEELRSALREG